MGHLVEDLIEIRKPKIPDNYDILFGVPIPPSIN